jgi:hypothetical protein
VAANCFGVKNDWSVAAAVAGFHRCLKFLQAAGDDLKVCVCPELRRQPRVYALGYIQCFDIFRKACDLYWRNDCASIGKRY